MASIQQAVYWLKDGNKVKREEWNTKGDVWLEELPEWSKQNVIHYFYWHEPGKRYIKYRYEWSMDDILAIDWVKI